jgi:hypothetical protein
MLIFSCYNCGLIMDLKDEMAGQKWKCPACGESVLVPAQNPEPKAEGKGKAVTLAIGTALLGLMAGGAAGGVVGFYVGKSVNYRPPEARTEDPAFDDKAPRHGPAAARVDASVLYDQFLYYLTESDELYKGKVLEVFGHVAEVKKEGRPHLALRVRDGENTFIRCYFENKTVEQLARYNKKTVRVKGRCRQSVVWNGLDECEVVAWDIPRPDKVPAVPLGPPTARVDATELSDRYRANRQAAD